MANTSQRPLFWLLMIVGLLLIAAAGGELLARASGLKPHRIEQSAWIGWAHQDPVLGWRNNSGVYRSHEGAHEPMTYLADGSRATGGTPGSPTPAASSLLLIRCTCVFIGASGSRAT